MAVISKVQVYIHEHGECSVSLESSVFDEYRREFDVTLFSRFATRQLASLGPSDPSAQPLATKLLRIRDTAVSLALGEIGETARLVRYPGTPSKKRFFGELRQDGSFVLKVKGFGHLGLGSGDYASTSVLALLSFLLQERSCNEDTVSDLLNAANLCGAEYFLGKLSLAKESEVAQRVAVTARLKTSMARPSAVAAKMGVGPRHS